MNRAFRLVPGMARQAARPWPRERVTVAEDEAPDESLPDVLGAA